MFYYGKEYLKPRGCELRSFRIKIEPFFRNICAHVNPILTEIRYVHVWTENMGSGPLGKVSFRMLDDPFQEIRTI